MNVYVGDGQVAAGPEYAVTLRVANKPGMAVWIDGAPTDRETQFEGHVEAQDARAISGDVHSRQVVNGVAAAMQKGLGVWVSRPVPRRGRLTMLRGRGVRRSASWS